MKDLTPTRGGALLRRMVAEGEHQRQDFKFAISDARKIARSICAFANRDGGRLLIGVKDNGSLAGVRNEEDIYVVEQAAQRYCIPPQDVDFKAYSFDAKGIIIAATVEKCHRMPVYVDEGGGKKRAYYRVADENIAAHPLMIRAWERRKSVFAPVISQQHSALLALLDQPREVDPVSLAISLHCSRATAEELIVSLAAIGSIEFIHTQGRFFIATASNEQT